MNSDDHIRITETFAAHNYSPLPVVLTEGQGVWVTDVEGRRYLDMLSAYSALNFGHRHPRLVEAAKRQLDRLPLSSRAFYNDQLGLFCKELAELCGMEMVLPMTSGAEAVETTIKLARKWGYEKQGIPAEQAEIITFRGNFHGRTTTIVGFSDSPSSTTGFGPFTPGFQIVPYGDAARLANAIRPTTVGVLIEPIQGEAGVIMPPEGFLREVRELCTKNRVLMLADEIQTGLGRTGKLFACDHEQVKPDVYMIGKSLGGGLVPLSAVVANKDVMSVFTPGTHGSTFGGNPLACAIARESLLVLRDELAKDQIMNLGAHLVAGLRGIGSSKIKEVRGRGLLIGVDIDKSFGPAKKIGLALKEHGILCKDTRDQTLRFAPPLTIERAEIDWALERIRAALSSL